MLLINIAAGVALMLFGVRFLRKGLDRLFGRSLHTWLDRIAHSRGRAAFAGACVGIVAPSSTAQTLLSLQLLGSGRLSIERTLVFLLAANAGISATVQLIALRVFDYFGVFLVPGLAGFYLLRSPRRRGAAQVCLALGFIFLGMNLVSEQARELAAGPTFATLLGLLAEQSVMVALLAAGFTVACQSSTACIGLALGLTASGHVSLALLVPVIVGANLGMGVTSVLASYTTREGRWLGAMNLGLKTVLAVAALAALQSLTALLANTPGDLTRQAANFHTAFGLAVAALGFALARPLGALARRELNRHRTDAA
ncbi:MAG TPA: Na/Pi symporter, partial [Opitutus sp.]|nr:Na/Pi symporter [Opitutus sp.]